jgi:purine catabolism regulator
VGMDPWRRLLLDTALDHGLDATLVSDLGLGSLDPHRACVLVVRPVAGTTIEDATMSALARVPGVVAAREGTGALAFAPVGSSGAIPPAIADVAAAPGVAAVGVSSALDLTDAGNARQAADQARRAAALGSGLRLFDDAPARGLGSLIDAATTSAWAQEYLADLLTVPEGAELRDTLRAWLDQHGQVDAAAQQLGIHRHTVRHRLRRAEAVLGRSLDDPAVRADLFFALGAVR